MFEFIKIQFELGRIDADQVQAFVPRWISDGQAKDILKET